MQSNGEAAVLTKFTRQAADLGAVFLYKEGLFVRAYNEGAYGFVHQILACKPMRRFVKSAGEERVVCGVPFTVLSVLPAFAQAEQLDALSWRWPLAKLVEWVQYAAWRESLPLQMPNQGAARPAPTKQPNPAQGLVDQLMQFNVATSTPMAALNLLADLQRQWRENMQESEVA